MKRDTVFFRGLTSCGHRGMKALYKDSDGYYYQWDSLHGEWEKFDRSGRHVGTLNAEGTAKIKNAIKSRKINI